MLVPENFPDRSVCVLGLGYVGLTLAATMASVGFRVWGIEIRPQVVADLRKGRAAFPRARACRIMLQPSGRKRRAHRAREHPRRLRRNRLHHHGRNAARPQRPRAPRHDRAHGARGGGRDAAECARGPALDRSSSAPRGSVVPPILEATGSRLRPRLLPRADARRLALKELRTLPQIVGGGDAAGLRARLAALPVHHRHDQSASPTSRPRR